MPNPNSTVKTRKNKNMANADIEGLRKSLSELILANHNEVKSMIAALEHSISALETSLNAKNDRIDALEIAINSKDEHVNELEKRLSSLEENLVKAVKKNVSLSAELHSLCEHFEVEIDNLQQYQRKGSLRLEGLKYTREETNAQLKTQVVTALNNMQANIAAADIYRLHRSSIPHKDRDTGELVAQTIIRFSSWDARQRAYQSIFQKKTIAANTLS